MIVRILRLLAAIVVVNGLLVYPRWLAPDLSGTSWIALEAAFIAGILLFVPPGRWGRLAARIAAGLVIAVGLLGLADATIRLILARPLNLYVDVWLGRAVLNLLYGNAGIVLGTVLLGLALGGVVGVWWVLSQLLRPAEPVDDPGMALLRPRPGLHGYRRLEPALGALLVAPLLISLLARGVTDRPPVGGSTFHGTPALALITDQSTRLGAMLSERERFAAIIAEAPESYADVPGLFGRLDGRDVVLAFIESYGVSALDDPRYAAVMGPRVEDLGRRVAEAGLFMASGTLVAPTQGGESWFSHGSLLSGLWLDNQIRYDLMITGDRETLVDDFRRAGYRTVAVMPAITYAWPEGEALGYDTIYGRNEIPYAGPPLNWVTMPDQFVWHFVNRDILSAGESPMFVEVGLISSHAPWTPILPVLEDWEGIGDGSVFLPWRDTGDPPEVLWLDPERVREHYALAVDYAVNALAGYAERYVDEGMLLIAMGDHQPAPLVTGDGASWEVPVHVISGDPALVEPFLAWGFHEGPVPSRDHSDRGMDYFRDWFVRAYAEEGDRVGGDIGDGGNATDAGDAAGADAADPGNAGDALPGHE